MNLWFYITNFLVICYSSHRNKYSETSTLYSTIERNKEFIKCGRLLKILCWEKTDIKVPISHNSTLYATQNRHRDRK
jgi:hypothetical protein